MTPVPPQRVVAIVTVVAIVGLASTFDVNLAADARETVDGLIQRVVAQTTRSGVTIRSHRELRAGTISGKHQGWMAVETALNSTGAFTWKVIEEGGSERTRNKVFREILQAEAESSRAGARDDAALTLANYEFHPLPSTRPDQIQFRLKPRRADSKLIDGTLTASADGYPLVLEGTMAKSPSFWVKSVTVVKRYGRFAGVALPTTIESLAELRMFGRSNFSMRYRYSEVNGRPIAQSVASAPTFGPSVEILALHASRTSGFLARVSGQ